MKDTKEQNTDLLKLSLYLISLWILFFMLIVLKMDISTIPFKLKLADIGEFLYRNSVSGICFVFILLGGVGYWWFKDSLNNAKQLPVEIRECESINYENLSFLATYIIPLVCYPMETEREVFFIFSVIVIIGCIFVKTDLYYTNPSLILLGFNVYRVRTNSGKEFRQGIAIIKGKLKKGDNIKYLPLSDNVYFGRVVKREDKRVKK